MVPEQIVESPVMETTGSGFTIRLCVAVATQPLSLVTVTVYKVVMAGDTMILGVVSPVLQLYDPPPDPVSVAVAPTQIEAGPEILALGSGLTLMVTDAEEVHPSILVTVTVYTVVMEGETIMSAVMAPVLHEYDPPPLAMRLTVVPSQIDPSLAIPDVSDIAMDALGSGFTVTV